MQLWPLISPDTGNHYTSLWQARTTDSIERERTERERDRGEGGCGGLQLHQSERAKSIGHLNLPPLGPQQTLAPILNYGCLEIDGLFPLACLKGKGSREEEEGGSG